MKTKALVTPVRDKVKVVGMYRSGLGYKNIYKTLNIPQSTVKSLIIVFERIWHHNKPAERGPPPKTHGPGKEGIHQRQQKDRR